LTTYAHHSNNDTSGATFPFLALSFHHPCVVLRQLALPCIYRRPRSYANLFKTLPSRCSQGLSFHYQETWVVESWPIANKGLSLLRIFDCKWTHIVRAEEAKCGLEKMRQISLWNGYLLSRMLIGRIVCDIFWLCRSKLRGFNLIVVPFRAYERGIHLVPKMLFWALKTDMNEFGRQQKLELIEQSSIRGELSGGR
jgi:hypothetical protein